MSCQCEDDDGVYEAVTRSLTRLEYDTVLHLDETLASDIHAPG
jgi:hypothetical protein